MGTTTSHGSCMQPDTRSSKQNTWTTTSGGSTRSSSTEEITTGPSSGGSGASPLPSALGGSLASRRKGSNPRLHVRTSFEEEDGTIVQANPRRSIGKGVFKEQYNLQTEVMPSCHRGMQIMFATCKATGNEVVIKIRFKKESFRTPQEEVDWRESTEFMLNLPKCECIAEIYDVIEDDNNYYVIMEKVAGKDLFESMTGQELLPVPQVKIILRQILNAIHALHKKGRIHKDLKLENVMFDRTDTECDYTGIEDEIMSPMTVKLIDFDTVETPKQAVDVLGTDQYIAPEAYDGKYTPASDIFAIGVVAFQLLTGKLPFSADMFDDKPGENWVGSPKMKSIRTKLSKYRIKWTYDCFKAEPRCCDLLRSMLAINVANRPTAEEALAHPWLALELPTPTLSTKSCSVGEVGFKRERVKSMSATKDEKTDMTADESGPMIGRSVSDGHFLSHPHSVSSKN